MINHFFGFPSKILVNFLYVNIVITLCVALTYNTYVCIANVVMCSYS